MKKILMIVASVMITINCIAWEQVNIGDHTEILLKTGYLVRGQVIENVPGEMITLETLDGTRITYQYTEIESIGRGVRQKSKRSFTIDYPFSEMKLHLTANVGFGITGITNKDKCYGCDPKSSFKFPALFGVGIKADHDTLFSVHADLNFERKGYKFSSSSGDYIQKLNYLTLPLYLSINYPYDNLIIVGHAGIYTSIKLNENLKHDHDNYYYWHSDHNNFDIGWLIGAGVELPYDDQISLRTQLRYARGLRRAPEYYKMKNRSLIVLIGVVYSL